MNYQIQLPPDCDVHRMLKQLKELEEEEPQLHIVWDEQLAEIHAMLMGDSGIGDALRETFSSYKRHLKLASIVLYMVIKRTNSMHHYEPFSKVTWLPWSRPMNDGQITRLFQSVPCERTPPVPLI